MTKSYYTSLCRAWLDHNVLGKPSEQERFIELNCVEGNIERTCEWIIDRLQSADSGSRTEVCLQDHIEEIDFIMIAEALSEQCSV